MGDFGHRTGDIICLGKCDDVVRDLARELGWEEDLLKEWEATAGTVEPEEVEDTTTVKNESEKEQLQTEVDKLASEVEKSLAISETSPVHKEDGEAKSSVEVEEPVLQIPNPKKEEEPSVAEANGSKIPGSIETKPGENL